MCFVIIESKYGKIDIVIYTKIKMKLRIRDDVYHVIDIEFKHGPLTPSNVCLT